jgi:hypothetical protein
MCFSPVVRSAQADGRYTLESHPCLTRALLRNCHLQTEVSKGSTTSPSFIFPLMFGRHRRHAPKCRAISSPRMTLVPCSTLSGASAIASQPSQAPRSQCQMSPAPRSEGDNVTAAECCSSSPPCLPNPKTSSLACHIPGDRRLLRPFL